MQITGLPALKRAIEIIGTQTAVALVVGVTAQAVSDMVRNGKRVPAEWCRPLEIATAKAGEKISAHQLRPDLFEAPAKRVRRANRPLRTAEARA
jgi:DNA-binding transcriptional regulator YdaS (Cro superfamily)